MGVAGTATSPSPSPEVRRLLTAPILPTLLGLAAPSVLAMVMQVAVGIAETVYIGRLGATPLAAMALVFPFVMLAQQLSAGAMGGGVSSAVSRALGAGDLARAQTLALHALAIGGLLGALFTALMLAAGPLFYRWLGGRGEVLQQAVDFAALLFPGALLIWLNNTLASVLRGSGNMRVPSAAILAASLLQIVLGGVLALGAGPVPSLGMAGVAIAFLVANGACVAFFGWYLASGQGRLRLQWQGVSWRREMFGDILRVGAVSMISPFQSVGSVLLLTGFVARLGELPLAGYAIGQRLEFLLIPISFGIGVAALPMVGMAMGAGDVARARRVAWTAGATSAVNLGLIGLLVALAPDLWAGLFSRDEAVLAPARQFLQIAGPAFPLFGLGLTLYFASQGAGRVLGPVLAGTLRLAVVAVLGSWLVARPELGAAPLFGLVAAAMAVYGLGTAAAVWFTPWGRGR
ncbi:MAG: MATE family efflux transporter [Burkholderiaceae bacterium]|nr:MATE family efflux transporter [Burkholderiaceae bacterium]